MITRGDFGEIDKEVKNAVTEAFEYIKTRCSDDKYLLFLADAEYMPKYIGTGYSPYVIDSRIDIDKDATRQRFFSQFMNAFYSFSGGLNHTDDNEYRLTMELMVYCHIWESKPFLKQLRRFALLASEKIYQWETTVPDMSKHEFIRNDVRNSLKDCDLKIADVISKGFHTSLRNAFAHSEYSIEEQEKTIHLYTYTGKSWDIPSIKFDDWTKNFLYSAFLSYHFLNEKKDRRQSINRDFGKEQYNVVQPINKRRFRVAKVLYDEVSDNFSYN